MILLFRTLMFGTLIQLPSRNNIARITLYIIISYLAANYGCIVISVDVDTLEISMKNKQMEFLVPIRRLHIHHLPVTGRANVLYSHCSRQKVGTIRANATNFHSVLSIRYHIIILCRITVQR